MHPQVALAPLRRAAASALALALTVPARPAQATGMEGLAVVLLAMFVEAPAALLLVASIVASAVILGRRTTSSWYGAYAIATYVVAPALALALPAAAVLLDGGRALGVMLFFDLPAIVLGAIAAFLGYRVGVRGRPRR